MGGEKLEVRGMENTLSSFAVGEHGEIGGSWLGKWSQRVFFFLKMIACLYANGKEPKGPKGAGGSGALLLSRHENIWI